MKPVPQFSAASWNELVREVERFTPGSGSNSRVRSNADGGCAVDYTGPRPTHPWEIYPFWNPDIKFTRAQRDTFGRSSGMWCMRVRPGFVNGLEPCILMRTDQLAADAAVFGNNYGKKRDAMKKERIEVLLTDNPRPFIDTLSFRDATTIRSEGAQYAPGRYPDFFKFLGALPEQQLDAFQSLFNQYVAGDIDSIIDIISGESDLEEQGGPAPSQFPSGTRRLFSCDIVLHVNRPGIEPAFLLDRFGVPRPVGYNIVDFNRSEYQARVFAISEWVDLNLLIALGDPMNRYELPLDEMKLATVYLLSPENSTGGAPDGSWQPYVQHDVFWNLMYRSIELFENFPSDHDFDAILNTLLFLGGGGGFLPAAAITEPIELAFDQIEQLLNRTTMAGRFWTAA